MQAADCQGTPSKMVGAKTPPCKWRPPEGPQQMLIPILLVPLFLHASYFLSPLFHDQPTSPFCTIPRAFAWASRYGSPLLVSLTTTLGRLKGMRRDKRFVFPVFAVAGVVLIIIVCYCSYE